MSGPRRKSFLTIWTRNTTSRLTLALRQRTRNAGSITQSRITDFPKIGGGETVFCNPPYGRYIREWVKKAYEESKKPGTKVVMLLPSRTDAGWFHDYCLQGKIEFLRGRLKYGDAKENAPFPSMLVIFGE